MSLFEAGESGGGEPWFRLPTGLIGMAILIVVVEGWVARHAAGFMNICGWEWRSSALAARQNTRDCRVLILGDSTVKTAILPRAVEAAYGGKAYNLAAGGSPPSLHYYLLRRALESGSRPAAIVLSCLPRHLAPPPQEHAELWPYFLSLRELAELCWTADDGALFGRLVFARAVPSIRYRLPIRSLLSSSRDGQYTMNRLLAAILTRAWQVNRGAFPRAALEPGKALPDLEDWARRDFTGWTCHPTNDLYLRRFLSLAQSHDIPVYWVLIPVAAEVHDYCVRYGYDNLHMSYLRQLQREFPNFRILDAQGSGYDHAAFNDPHHLGIPGAVALSFDLGEELARRERQTSPGPALARLPAYRSRHLEFPLEDHVAAAAALQKSWVASAAQSLRR